MMTRQRTNDAPVNELYEDLAYLARNGALTGIIEIVRERRRQIEQKFYTVTHDRDTHTDGALAQMAAGMLSELADQRLEGLADPASDEVALAGAGAMTAAEIDRLAADFDPEPAGFRC